MFYSAMFMNESIRPSSWWQLTCKLWVNKETGMLKEERRSCLAMSVLWKARGGFAWKNTHGFIHVKGSSGSSLFTHINSTLKSSQTIQYLYWKAPYWEEQMRKGGRYIYSMVGDYKKGVGQGQNNNLSQIYYVFFLFS